MKKINKNTIFIASIVLAAALIVIGVIIKILLLPSFQISSKPVKIEAGKAFDAKSYITEADNIDEIKISEKVDNQRPGKYKITYSYKDTKKVLTVNVVDSIAPKLTPKSDFSVFAGEAVTAQMLVDVEDVTECQLKLDAHGQDLSVIGEYTVTVSATDSGKNTSKCEVTAL